MEAPCLGNSVTPPPRIFSTAGSSQPTAGDEQLIADAFAGRLEVRYWKSAGRWSRAAPSRRCASGPRGPTAAIDLDLHAYHDQLLRRERETTETRSRS